MKQILSCVFVITVIVISFCSCNNDSQTTPASSDLTPADTGTVTGQTASSYTYRKIQLLIKQGSGIPDSLKNAADSAFLIASKVFNSVEFQDALRKMDFKFSSNCLNGDDCKYNMKDNGSRIPGTTVLDSLFKESVVSIEYDLQLDGKSLGKTCPGDYAMIAYYNNILYDMRKDSIPRAAKLAVNLCHEYMHQVGYCHIYGKLAESSTKPDQRYINEDVTYWVGWEAFYILDRWVKEGKPVL